jgi:hypothetical protein
MQFDLAFIIRSCCDSTFAITSLNAKFEEGVNNFGLQNILTQKHIEEFIAYNEWSLEELKNFV